MSDSIPQGADGCERCFALRDQVRFWREQQKFAASVVANLADLDDYDDRLAALRQLLRRETERRRAAEHENAVLTYRLAQATGTEA